MEGRRRGLAFLLILGVATLSGISLLLVKDVAPRFDGWAATGWRLCPAAALVGILFWRRLAALDRSCWRIAIPLGTLYSIAILLQILSLQYTTVSHAAVFIGTYIVITPLASATLGEIKASRQLWWSVGLTFGGLVLISGWSSSYSLLGDALALLSAICWGILFAVTERAVRGRDSAPIALAQVVCTLPLGLLALALSDSTLIPSDGDIWLMILITAVIVTVLGVVVQLFAQKYLSATTVALLFAAQTPVALLCGVLVAGDALPMLALLGLVFASMGIALGMRLKPSEARGV